MATLHETLTANTTTNINVGSNLLYHGIVIKYACVRGVLYQAGEMSILNETASVEYDVDWFGDDIGLTLTADLNGTDMRINAAVDNSSVDDVTFNYNITKILI